MEQNGEGARNIAVATLAVLAFAYPLFGLIMPGRVTLATFFLATITIGFWFVASRGWERRGMGGVGIVWIGLGVYSGISNMLSGASFTFAVPVLIASTVMAYLLATTRAWLYVARRVLLGMLLLHSVSTILFYFFPILFDTLVRPYFFTDTPHWDLDYRTALTPNSGYNAMFASLGFLLSATSLFSHKRQGGVGKRWSQWMLVGIFFLALILTSKRAHPLYAVMVLIFVYMVSRARDKWVRAGVAVLVGTAALTWLAGVSEGVGRSLGRIASTFGASDWYEITTGRTFLWEKAIEGWGEAPFIGKGWGSFFVAWPDGQTQSVIAHNQILNLLYEGGLAGTALFAVAAVGSLVVAYRGMKGFMDRDGSAWTVPASGAFAVQAFLLLYSCTGGELLSKPYTLVPYFLAVSVGFCVKRELDAQSEIPEAHWPTE